MKFRDYFKSKIYSFLCMYLLTAAIAINVFAVDKTKMLEYEVKAAMIEKILFFVEWPYQERINDDNIFVMGLFAEDETIEIFKKYYSDRDILELDVEIVSLDNSSQIDNCDLVFISDSSKILFDEIRDNALDKSIFIIVESKTHFKAGAHINFFTFNRKVRFEVNLSAANENGFNINSLLLNYAKRVITD